MTGMTSLTDRASAHRMDRAEFERWREGIDDRTDRNRYELLKGEVLVTPAPSTRHQIAVGELYLALRSACPKGMRVLFAPYDVALPVPDDDILVQPDLLVAPVAEFEEHALERAPLLVVEVLSPTTWHRDLGSKRDAYAGAGVEHYWVLAPKVPALTVYRLGPGGTQEGYREVTHVEGEQVARLTSPFDVELSPVHLVR